MGMSGIYRLEWIVCRLGMGRTGLFQLIFQSDQGIVSSPERKWTVLIERIAPVEPGMTVVLPF
jgi:hypothetical protein